MRHLLSLLLILTTFSSCYLEDVYLRFLAPRIGAPALFSFRAQRPFDFDQEKAFGSRRNLAISQYIPLYSYVPDRVETAKKKMQEIAKRIVALQSDGQADPAAFSKYLRKELGFEINEKAAAQLISYPNVKDLLQAVLTIEESILQGKIVADPQPIKGKTTAEILYPAPVGTVAYPAGELMTIEGARQNLQKKISQVFYQVDRNILEPVIQMAQATLTPNLMYDQDENDRRIEEIIRRYPSRVVSYRAGDVLVPFGKTMTEEDVLLLSAHREVEKGGAFGAAPWLLFALTFAVILYCLLLSHILEPRVGKKPPYLLLLSLLTMSVLLMKTYLLLSVFPVYSVPFCLLPLLLVFLERERISITWTVLLGALLVSLFSGRNVEVLLFYAFGGCTAILASKGMRKRSHVLIPSLLVGIVNALVVLVILLDWKTLALWALDMEKAKVASTGGLSQAALFSRTGWAFLGGMASGPAALLLLPLMELAWHRVSFFKLSQYTDLQHSLLRDLLTRAPGTYQHAMTVAYLAEAAGQAIGANTLLLRAGAYYHDIGKTVEPGLFIENQFGGKNPHDDLAPAESARIIIGHVTAGIDMARKAGLPEQIRDFIPQHHGTQLVEYFYDKASRENQADKPEEQFFRYPGPKPQSRETAILMIVDAVEASSRTLQEPTREKIQSLVHFIIAKRMSNGQFDECTLSTRDIAKIVQTLTNSLEAAFHVRVEYPWQKEAAENRS